VGLCMRNPDRTPGPPPGEWGASLSRKTLSCRPRIEVGVTKSSGRGFQPTAIGARAPVVHEQKLGVKSVVFSRAGPTAGD